MICSKKNKVDSDFCSLISKKYSIHVSLCEYLFSCGINTLKKAERFFSCQKEDLLDSFSMSGIKQAYDRIFLAIDSKERIIIFGDYDADGVCSCAILFNVIKDLGGNVDVYIPTREDGYGITEDAIDYILSELSPSLIITVDCGISAHEEIEVLKDIGIDVIVTDHHNLPEILPECILINPKLDTENIELANLCGAGVAFKLAQALNPECAYKYIDFACIATIADSVDILYENRNIVKLGLIAMQESPKPYITAFLENNNKIHNIGTEEIAFYLAPLINAAGRMDTATIAFEYLLCDSIDKARESFAALQGLNEERKKLCEEHTEKLSKKIISNQLFDRRGIIVKSKHIPKGIVGIVAAKLTEKYHRPALIFSQKDGVYYGSGRSIATLNLYDIMLKSKHLYLSFGGHAMACGVSIEEDNFDEFVENTFSELEKLSSKAFLQVKEYDMLLDAEQLTTDFAIQTQKLAPYGVGFAYPRIMLETKNIQHFSFASNPKYLKAKVCKDIFAVTFCGDKYINNFLSNDNIELLLKLDTFKNYLNVGIQDVDCKYDIASINDDVLYAKYVEQLYFKRDSNVRTISHNEFTSKLDSCLENIYGTAIIINTKKANEYFNSNILPKLKNSSNILQKYFISPYECKSQNCIIFGGSMSINFEEYKNVFFVDKVLNNNFLKQIESKNVINTFCLDFEGDTSFLSSIDISKNTFSKIFLDIKRVIATQSIAFDILRWYNIIYAHSNDISILQYTVAMLTFLQLKIFKFDKQSGKIQITDKKCELQDSILYNNLQNGR